MKAAIVETLMCISSNLQEAKNGLIIMHIFLCVKTLSLVGTAFRPGQSSMKHLVLWGTGERVKVRHIPVWVRLCLARWYRWKNLMSHMEQAYGFTPAHTVTTLVSIGTEHYTSQFIWCGQTCQKNWQRTDVTSAMQEVVADYFHNLSQNAYECLINA